MTEPSLQWILLAVDKDNDAFILDADSGFWELELILEHWAEDSGITLPANLSVGLWRMSNIVITPSSDDDPDISGTWEKIA